MCLFIYRLFVGSVSLPLRQKFNSNRTKNDLLCQYLILCLLMWVRAPFSTLFLFSCGCEVVSVGQVNTKRRKHEFKNKKLTDRVLVKHLWMSLAAIYFFVEKDDKKLRAWCESNRRAEIHYTLCLCCFCRGFFFFKKCDKPWSKKNKQSLIG